MKKIFFLILGIIIIYGSFLRFYHLWFQSFWIDEGYSSIVSYFMQLNSFIPKLPSGIYDFSQYFFNFFQTVSFALFWTSDFSARLFSVLLNILTWLLLLLFSYEWIVYLYKKPNKKLVYIVLIVLWVLFYFSNWEIIWSRQARFYSLLVFLFLLCLYLLFKVFILNDEKYFKYLVILLSIWIVFHPFMWSLLLIFLIYLWYEVYKNKKLPKEYVNWLIIWLIIFLIQKWIIFYFAWNVNLWLNPHDIWSLEKYYVNYYNKHLFFQLWIIYILFFIWIIYLLYKDTKLWFFVLLAWFVNVYTITHKWILFHTRYVFHLYTLILFVFTLVFYWLIEKIFEHKDIIKYLYMFFVLFILVEIIFTYKFNFFPKKEYFIDWTSPQPNFKWAYSFVNWNLTWSKIISWFPHMCLWYQKILNWKFNCKYWLKVNLTGHLKSEEKLKQLKNDRYTWIRYFTWNTYTWFVFVLDDLSLRMNLDKDLVWKVLKNCKLVYRNWKRYNFIWVWDCR